MNVRSRDVLTRACIGLAAVLVGLVVVACGGSSSGKSTSSASASAGTSTSSSGATKSGQAQAQAIITKLTAATPFKVAPLPKAPSKNVTIASVDCTLPVCQSGATGSAARVLGWHYIDVPFDVTKGPPAFAAAMTQALQKNPNYIVMVGVFPPATIAPELAQAKAKGVKVIEVAGSGTNPAIIQCDFCLKDDEQSGALLADEAIAKYGTNASLAFATDTTLIPGQSTNAGVLNEFKRLGATAPGVIHVAQTQSPAANAAAVISYLQKNPDTQAVISDLPSDTVGLPAALAQAGLSQKVAYITSEPSAADLGYLKSGQEQEAVGYSDRSIYWQAVDAAARSSEGQSVPLNPGTWFQILTKANVAAAIAASGDGPTGTDPPHYQAIYAKAWKG